MAQQPRSAQDLPTEFADRVLLFPARNTPRGLAKVRARSADRPPTVRQALTRHRVLRQVAVLEAAGRLTDVIEELGLAIQLALADGPRGVVCDLSAALETREPQAVEALATAGRHVRDWPGIPVAVVCPDPRVAEALCAHDLGSRLIVTTSLFSAMRAVLTAPAVAVMSLHLAPHPTAPRAAREFVTRTLRDWRLSQVIPVTMAVVSDLVSSSAAAAGTDMDLSLAWDRGALRLTVRDHAGPELPFQRPCSVDLPRHGRTVEPDISARFGVLPAADGGKLVWAVFDAPRLRPPTSRTQPECATADLTSASPDQLSGSYARNMTFLSQVLTT